LNDDKIKLKICLACGEKCLRIVFTHKLGVGKLTTIEHHNSTGMTTKTCAIDGLQLAGTE